MINWRNSQLTEFPTQLAGAEKAPGEEQRL
jgi:hypothetical protein